MVDLKDKKMYKRISINTSGSTCTVTQSAANLSEALEQELMYKSHNGAEVAQVNITYEKDIV